MTQNNTPVDKKENKPALQNEVARANRQDYLRKALVLYMDQKLAWHDVLKEATQIWRSLRGR